MADAKPISFLSDAELADIDQRNAAADRLCGLFMSEPPAASELERLVAEVRYWRRLAAERAKEK